MEVQSRRAVSIFRRMMKTAGAVLAFVCLVQLGGRSAPRACDGCYQIDLGWPEFPGNVLVLKSAVVWEGEYQGAPRVDRFSGPQWRPSPYPGGRDSLTVIWRTVDQGSVLLSFRWLGDSLIGRADGLIHKGYVVAYRSGCLPRV